jgi:hypothetical protein
MKIFEIIAREDCLAAKEIATLAENIRRAIDEPAHDRESILAGREAGELSPVQLKRFFRNREREENTRLILQYLLMFLDQAPEETVPFLEQEPPEKQLLEFVRYQVDLFLEKDVKKAILSEYSQLGILRTGNFWYYEGRIHDLHKELGGALAECPDHGAATLIQLCRILERICLFWFDLCREDVRRVRASDIFIYKLTLILRRKWQKTEAE